MPSLPNHNNRALVHRSVLRRLVELDQSTLRTHHAACDHLPPPIPAPTRALSRPSVRRSPRSSNSQRKAVQLPVSPNLRQWQPPPPPLPPLVAVPRRQGPLQLKPLAIPTPKVAERGEEFPARSAGILLPGLVEPAVLIPRSCLYIPCVTRRDSLWLRLVYAVLPVINRCVFDGSCGRFLPLAMNATVVRVGMG